MAQDIEMGFPSPLSGSKEELEAFLDNLFAEEMARLHLPGAVIALVRDDEICLVKGYGYANLEKGVKADPERSIFRVGSVSKLFTAVAVMQLAEKKLVDLHTDVAAYQDRIKLESRSGRTVTLAHLLTHTGGFDEKYLGISAKERSRTTPLGDYLSTEMPRQVRAPGEYFQYSNHGMALAGYIVEAVSGLSFAEYIDAEILEHWVNISLDSLLLCRQRHSVRLHERIPLWYSPGSLHAADSSVCRFRSDACSHCYQRKGVSSEAL
ncbi:MAG TPA: serine hydrolase domain-containing protein [Bacillota bacterium]|nr:serine hydrolase domain-containing protein [Bacillota bacterium]